MSGGCTMKTDDYIPDGITTDILLRLPPKSLLRFKTTCKSWYSLISHSSFITLHTHRTSQNPKFLFRSPEFQLLDSSSSTFDSSCFHTHRASQNPKLLFRSSEFHLFDSASSTFDESCLSTCIFPFESSHYIFLGSSHGLVCLTNGIKLYLWNPSIRELRKIPHPIPLARPNMKWPWIYDAHGLGYDPESDDLKLVLCKDKNIFYVFSVKSNSWKSFSCPPNFISNPYKPHPQAAVVNGVFHWLWFRQYSNDSQIIAFDSTKGELLNLPIPQLYNSRDACLLEHEGCLCISFSRSKVEEMWMLKEHAWVHFLSISLDYSGELRRPIYISRSGIKVLFYDERFIVRSSKNETYDQYFLLFHLPIHEAIMCCGTLVSPNHVILNEPVAPTEKKQPKKQKNCSSCIFCPPFPSFSIMR